ncbi:T9SS type A sorting domain-containing protein [Paraflavitalea soli]|nr:T9SS type A sorting domain-containing protein [Paraflavitalea soli]
MKQTNLFTGLLIFCTCCLQAQDALYIKNGTGITVQNGAVITVKGNVTLENGSMLNNQGIIYVGGSALLGAGHWTDLSATGGTYGTGRFVFDGTINQQISTPYTFSRLDINGSSLELHSNISAQKWYLQKGYVTTGAYAAIVTDASATALEADATNPGFTQSWINGALRRYITPASVSGYPFPVGNTVRSNLAVLTNLSSNPLTGISYIEARFVPKPGTDAGLVVTEGGATYVSVAPEGVWNISADASPTGGQYDLQLYFNGFSGLTDNMFAILQRPAGSTNGADWIRPTGSTIQPTGTPGRTVASGYAMRSNVTTFGQLGIGLTATSLPVTLVDFRAQRLHAGLVQLNWATATEQNNRGFDIERRWQTETAFKVIGFVPSLATGGNSNLLLRYQYADANAYKGVTYYRLNQIDLDNRNHYTLIKAVKGTGQGGVTVLMWPNPNKGQFSIRIDGNTKQLPATITDMNGRIIQQLTINGNTPVNIYGLVAGTYVVSIPDVFGSGEDFREKVLVVR